MSYHVFYKSPRIYNDNHIHFGFIITIVYKKRGYTEFTHRSEV